MSMDYEATPKPVEGEYTSAPKCEDCGRILCCPCAGGCQYFTVSCNGICTPKKQRNKEADLALNSRKEIGEKEHV
jgi:hypothetical protein